MSLGLLSQCLFMPYILYLAVKYILYISFLNHICFCSRKSEAPAIAKYSMLYSTFFKSVQFAKFL